MKANEAPNKIILSADRETMELYDEWVINDYTDNIKIEYTRTDTFIDKAANWLENNLKGIVFGGIYVEDFKKYMKGE